ncbi:hypothetical protein KFL_007050025 [Klebsormidium nitens]|uniref:Uncharacterized protein n=1 Tax=Klebsormidium nitens TaxID=105231 RepID=A0A1Y1IP38_KLENI|nr:hypothetical protein KFL_007050025 [Klebsormidium nitens]|eukprot:GAQ90941.1 hypothetical protein KFL_007050025 [Klebsormidium nitens]
MTFSKYALLGSVLPTNISPPDSALQDAEIGRKRSKGKKDAEKPDQRPEMTFSEYALLMQDSMSRLGLYADMLVEGVTGQREEAPPAGGQNRRVTFEPEGEAVQGGASKLIKHARKLAGSLHVDRQTVGLRSVRDWLMKLGDIATMDGDPSAAAATQAGAEGLGVDLAAAGGDWRLPNSPAMALQLAQEDLAERLSHLYAEKNYLLNRRAELEAAKRLTDKGGDLIEDQLLQHIKKLRDMEAEYEILGGRVTDCMGEVANLEGGFHQLLQEGEKLRREAIESAATSSRVSGVRKKKKKKGKKKTVKKGGARGSYSDPPSSESSYYSSEESGDYSDSDVSTSYDEVSTEEEEVEEDGRVVRKRVKKKVKKPVKKPVKKKKRATYSETESDSDEEEVEEEVIEEVIGEDGQIRKVKKWVKKVVKKKVLQVKGSGPSSGSEEEEEVIEEVMGEDGQVKKVKKVVKKKKARRFREIPESESDEEEEVTEEVVGEDGQVRRVKKKVKKKARRIRRVEESFPSSGSDEVDAEGNPVIEEVVTVTGKLQRRAKKKAGRKRVEKWVTAEIAGNDEVDAEGNVVIEEVVTAEGQVRRRVKKRVKRATVGSAADSGSDELDVDGNVVIEEVADVSSGRVQRRAKKKAGKARVVRRTVSDGSDSHDELDADGNVVLEEFVDGEGRVKKRVKKKVKKRTKPRRRIRSGDGSDAEVSGTDDVFDEDVDDDDVTEAGEVSEEIVDENGVVRRVVRKKKKPKRGRRKAERENDELDENGDVILEEVMDPEGRVRTRVKKKVRRTVSGESESDEVDSSGNVVIEEVADESGRVRRRAKKKKRVKRRVTETETESEEAEPEGKNDAVDEEGNVVLEEFTDKTGRVKRRVKKRVKRIEAEEEESGSDELDREGNPLIEEVTDDQGRVIRRAKKKKSKRKGRRKKKVAGSEESEEDAESSEEEESGDRETGGLDSEGRREKRREHRRKGKGGKKGKEGDAEISEDDEREGKKKKKKKGRRRREGGEGGDDSGTAQKGDAEGGTNEKEEVSRSKSRKERHHRRRRRSSGERGERRASRDPKINNVLQRLLASTKMRQKATQTDDASLQPPSRGRTRGDGFREKFEEKEVECKGLRKDLNKLRQQLRFWRQRNWAQKHGKPLPPLNGMDPNVLLDLEPEYAGRAPPEVAGTGAERMAGPLPTTSLEPPLPPDALSHFQSIAQKVSAVTFFSRIKRAPVTRVSFGRDPAAGGPWKYDPAALRGSAEAPERGAAAAAGAPESPTVAVKNIGDFFGEAPGPVSPGVVRKARGVIGPGAFGLPGNGPGEPFGDARAAAGTTGVDFRPPDARGDENAAAAASHMEEERNHVMWLRLRERMRALLGQMPGGAPFEGTSSFRSPSTRNPRSLSAGFGAFAAASPSGPVVGTPAFSPGQASREEEASPARIVSPYVTGISPTAKAGPPASLGGSKKRLPVLGTSNPRRAPSPRIRSPGPQMLINNRAARPFDELATPPGRARAAAPMRPTVSSDGKLPRGGLPELGVVGGRAGQPGVAGVPVDHERAELSHVQSGPVMIPRAAGGNFRRGVG